MELALDWIARYGYFGIFSLLVLGIVGLPVPDETLLTFAGYLVFRGKLEPVPTALSAFSGSICGITISYVVGRATGYVFIEKYGTKLHLPVKRVHKVHDWFRHMGRFTLTFGYFVPGVRHLTAYVAGASELEAPPFAAYAYSGAAIWTATFITLGYVLGEQWTRVEAGAHKLLLAAGGALVVMALAYLLWRRRRKHA